MVSETISQVDELTHGLCGWSINKMVSETISDERDHAHSGWVGDQGNGQRNNLKG